MDKELVTSFSMPSARRMYVMVILTSFHLPVGLT
uniref:Uncharacterized protein n=1 Tax=Rhizophora mucronata TaxID=61149 RepID=A0A2P2NWV4_RHIMU